MYVYYISFVYVDRHGKDSFGDTLYQSAEGIKTANDIKDIASLLRMEYEARHLRILGFSLMRRTETKEALKNIIQENLMEFLTCGRTRQKLKAWRKKKGRRKKC